MTRVLVATVRYSLIAAAIALLPLYGLWVAGGAYCDWRERKSRCDRVQK
jgi:hypothetical protein